jgi:hypothetical protein
MIKGEALSVLQAAVSRMPVGAVENGQVLASDSTLPVKLLLLTNGQVLFLP